MMNLNASPYNTSELAKKISGFFYPKIPKPKPSGGVRHHFFSLSQVPQRKEKSALALRIQKNEK
jgi:hypothetical protein